MLFRSYYLDTVSDESEEGCDSCNGCFDIQTWHEILGHCNYDDVSRLQDVVEGMQIHRTGVSVSANQA